MTETLQVILTFTSICLAFTFFVAWLELKDRIKKCRKELAETEKEYDALRQDCILTEANLLQINAELGNKIDLLNEELKSLKRKNRIKGKK